MNIKQNICDNVQKASGGRSWDSLVLFCCVFWTGTAHAIVNMESLHLTNPPEGFSGQIEISADGASGNTNKVNASAGTRLQWHKDKNTSFLLANYSYGRSLGKTDTNSSFVHIRHIHQTTLFRAREIFTQLERNEFIRLSFRGLVGGGMRFTLGQSSAKKATFLGLGAFYAHEKLSAQQGLTDAGIYNTWRANLYFIPKYKLNNHTRLLSTTYCQPRLQAVNDYRLLETASLQIDIIDNLALQLGLNITHNSRPPQDVKQTDVVYQTGLNYMF